MSLFHRPSLPDKIIMAVHFKSFFSSILKNTTSPVLFLNGFFKICTMFLGYFSISPEYCMPLSSSSGVVIGLVCRRPLCPPSDFWIWFYIIPEERHIIFISLWCFLGPGSFLSRLRMTYLWGLIDIPVPTLPLLSPFQTPLHFFSWRQYFFWSTCVSLIPYCPFPVFNYIYIYYIHVFRVLVFN